MSGPTTPIEPYSTSGIVPARLQVDDGVELAVQGFVEESDRKMVLILYASDGAWWQLEAISRLSFDMLFGKEVMREAERNN